MLNEECGLDGLRASLPAPPHGGSRLLVTTQRGVSRKKHWSGEEGRAADAISVSRLRGTLHRLGEPSPKVGPLERSLRDTVPESHSGSLPPCLSPPTAPGVSGGLRWQLPALGPCWRWPVRQTPAPWPNLHAAGELLGLGNNHTLSLPETPRDNPGLQDTSIVSPVRQTVALLGQ